MVAGGQKLLAMIKVVYRFNLVKKFSSSEHVLYVLLIIFGAACEIMLGNEGKSSFE